MERREEKLPDRTTQETRSNDVQASSWTMADEEKNRQRLSDLIEIKKNLTYQDDLEGLWKIKPELDQLQKWVQDVDFTKWQQIKQDQGYLTDNMLKRGLLRSADTVQGTAKTTAGAVLSTIGTVGKAYKALDPMRGEKNELKVQYKTELEQLGMELEAARQKPGSMSDELVNYKINRYQDLMERLNVLEAEPDIGAAAQETGGKLIEAGQQQIDLAKLGLSDAGKTGVDLGVAGIESTESLLMKGIGISHIVTNAISTFGKAMYEADQNDSSEARQVAYALAKSGYGIIYDYVTGGKGKEKNNSNDFVNEIADSIMEKAKKSGNENALVILKEALTESGSRAIPAVIDPFIKALYDNGKQISYTFTSGETIREWIANALYEGMIGFTVGAVKSGKKVLTDTAGKAQKESTARFKDELYRTLGTYPDSRSGMNPGELSTPIHMGEVLDRAETTDYNVNGGRRSGNEAANENGIRESSQRAFSSDSGGTAQSVEGSAEQGGTGASDQIPADSGAGQLTFGKQLSTAFLGIAAGSQTDHVSVLTKGDTEQTLLAKKLAKKNGRRLICFGKGDLNIHHENVCCYVTGDRVFARADDNAFTAAQILRRELEADRMEWQEMGLENAMRFFDSFETREQRAAIFSKYEQAYQGSGLSNVEIWKEMLCDNMSRINQSTSFA